MNVLQPMIDALTNHCVFLLLVLPLVGAALVAVSSGMGVEIVRRTALTNVLLSVALTVVMVANYRVPNSDPKSLPKRLQMASESAHNDPPPSQPATRTGTTITDSTRKATWNVRVAVGVDGVSVWFVGAIALLMLAAVVAHWSAKTENPTAFFILLLLLQSALVGVFAALDVILFCVCLEASVLLMFVLIGRWGGENRRVEVQPFFHFQQLGSLLVFLGIVGLVITHSQLANAMGADRGDITFSIAKLTSEFSGPTAAGDADHTVWEAARPMILWPLLFGFAIKASVFPLHRWLPGAQSQAPTVIGIVLCGVAVNIGIYGAVRFLLPLLHASGTAHVRVFVVWALFSSLLAGLLALAQGDFRRILAYAVISHAGLCLAGIFSLNAVGAAGAVLRAVSQGFCFAGLAFLIGAIRQRYSTFEIKAFGGMLSRYPRLGTCFLLLVLAAVAVPGTGGFAATLTTLAGILDGRPDDAPHVAATACGLAGLMLIAAAMIWMSQRVLFGRFQEPVVNRALFASQSTQTDTRDLRPSECAVIAMLLAVVLWMGLCPQFFLSRITPSVQPFLPKATQQSSTAVSETAVSETAEKTDAAKPQAKGTP